MVITLIGYRGTGKSTLAFPLADQLGWTAIDADIELEKRAGRSIRSIFDTDGEPEFRRLERETLVDLLSRDRIVIAAGGGAVMNAETRRDFQNAGPVIWLKASTDTIERRISGDSTTTERRPNLTATGGRKEIEDLLAVRNPVYEKTATITIDTDGLDDRGIVQVKAVDEMLNELVQTLQPLVDQEVRP
jgi:shikimate kinase